MGEPKRVQITRHQPWRNEHPDAVIVDRRTKWGNPVTLEVMREHYPDHDADSLRRMVVSDFRGLVEGRFDEWPVGTSYPTLDEIRAELAGRDLACWCPLPTEGEPDHCHAAVLIEVANVPAGPNAEHVRTPPST